MHIIRDHFVQQGDPTVFGNLLPAEESIIALKKAISKDLFSYDESAGVKEAREAVVKYSYRISNLCHKDIILTSGCSMAIETCMKVLANQGDNILIPRPGWNYT